MPILLRLLLDHVTNPHAYLTQLLLSKDSADNITYYVYGLGLIGHEEADGDYKTYHYDLRGSTTAITDEEGNITDRIEYGPYGELIRQSGTTKTPFLFNGRDGVMTDNNGLYYMRARYYNPDIKRFINQDVVIGSINDGRSLNRYAYAHGNPISLIDPFGLSPNGASNLWNRFMGMLDSINEFVGSPIASAIIIATITVVTVVTVIAAAPAVAAAASLIAGMYVGVGTAAAIGSIASYVTIGVGIGVGLFGANETAKTLTGKNYMADILFGGNEETYTKVKVIFDIAALGAMQVASDNRGLEYNKPKSNIWAAKKKGHVSLGVFGKDIGNPDTSYGELDSLGRRTGVTATITRDVIGTGTSASSSIKPPGFLGGEEGHARGHLLGKQLGGSGSDPRNLVTLNQNPVNTPVMSSFERKVRMAVEAGETVKYSATPIYSGNDLLPSGVTLSAKGSGGFQLDVTILNRK